MPERKYANTAVPRKFARKEGASFAVCLLVMASCVLNKYDVRIWCCGNKSQGLFLENTAFYISILYSRYLSHLRIVKYLNIGGFLTLS
jgi:hypothetical protein